MVVSTNFFRSICTGSRKYQHFNFCLMMPFMPPRMSSDLHGAVDLRRNLTASPDGGGVYHDASPYGCARPGRSGSGSAVKRLSETARIAGPTWPFL
jgi:hypothetical protein